MDIRLFLTVFATVFLAEIGDKTQLVTLLFASQSRERLWLVFIGASLALVATSAIGVLAGGLVAQYLNPKALATIAGVGFIVIGVWTLWNALAA